MTLTVVILTVLLVALVLGAVLALHGWAIATDPGRRQREPRFRRTPLAEPARRRGGRADLAAR